ncbi:MAG: hypothetical protein GC151_18825 [Betaproteobacteria bacterium]|nr:hypothetical protein [Betaproteobacteria bacterium]
MQQLQNVESVYALTPLQRLMLVNVVLAGGSGTHIDQVHLELEGALEPACFRDAWTTVVARHPALRTAFFWEGLSTPMQVVRQTVDLPWVEEDCRSLDDEAREAYVARRLREEAERPLELDKAPVMRLVLLRTGADRYEFIWTYAVMLLDGWSVATVMREVFRLHEANRTARPVELPPAGPFRAFTQWLATRDEAEAERFWREAFAGVAAPTPVPLSGALPAVVTEAEASVECLLDDADLDRLRAAATATRVTLSTLVQGAWALVLAGHAHLDDVVFGIGSAGRPGELENVGSIVGQFTTNVPVRVPVRAATPVAEWLREVQRAQLDAIEHEYAPLDRIEQWSGLSGQRLFESIVQIHNFPLDGTFWDERGFTVTGLHKVVRTNYPLALVAIPKPGLTLRLVHDETLLGRTGAEALLAEVRSLLLQIAVRHSESVESLRASVPLAQGVAPARRTVGAARKAPVAPVPLTPLQSRLARIWHDVLGVEVTSPDDNLFELGGRSVHAVRIHERIVAEGLGKLSVVELFQHPTVALLAAHLSPDAQGAPPTLAEAEARGRQRADAARERRDRLRNARSHGE